MTLIDPDGARGAAKAVPGLPRDAEGPVFREPWEAQTFAMTLALHDRGLFTWPEWVTILAAELKDGQSADETDTGLNYYRHWPAALEGLLGRKGRDRSTDVGALPQRLGSRRRPHAPWRADRTQAAGFRLDLSTRRARWRTR